MGSPPDGTSVQSSHDDVNPLNALGRVGLPGTVGACVVPDPGGPDDASGLLGVITGGVAGTTAGSPYANRLGDSVPADVTTLGVASLRIASITWLGTAVGAAERNRAARPATWGAAIDVPLMVLVAVVDVCHAEVMPLPGAKRSRHEPKFEYEARASVVVVAPTVRAEFTLLAGDTVQASTFEFPAAATTVMPSKKARSIAALSESLFPAPRLRFITAGRVM